MACLAAMICFVVAPAATEESRGGPDNLLILAEDVAWVPSGSLWRHLSASNRPARTQWASRRGPRPASSWDLPDDRLDGADRLGEIGDIPGLAPDDRRCTT